MNPAVFTDKKESGNFAEPDFYFILGNAISTVQEALEELYVKTTKSTPGGSVPQIS